MLSVDEAIRQVLEQARIALPIACTTSSATGLILAEEVTSDVDSPPYDKSLVDGYAVIAADVLSGSAELEILEEITAGMVPHRAVVSGQATRIMTGAPLPDGADAVVMIERTEVLPGDKPLGRVRIVDAPTTVGQNIMPRATSMAAGEVVLRDGALLRGIELGLLAEVGRTTIRIIPRPTLAVLSTGDELVDSSVVPGPGQIRNSNGPMLMALAAEAHAQATDLGIAADDREILRQRIADGLERDVLVISGGVSAGVLDLVPSMLAELGVRQVFHKVQLKPGKPLWFGVRDRGERRTLVFGLPGNPVSTLVCFELFVRPALAKMSGHKASHTSADAELTAAFSHRGDRPTYHPARLSDEGGRWLITPLRWKGSADLRTLVEANALACFPPGSHDFQTGEIVKTIRLTP